jgi:hypothetical protein
MTIIYLIQHKTIEGETTNISAFHSEKLCDEVLDELNSENESECEEYVKTKLSLLDEPIDNCKQFLVKTKLKPGRTRFPSSFSNSNKR